MCVAFFCAGIFLFRKLKDITDWKKEDYFRRNEEKSDKEPPETYVVQRYTYIHTYSGSLHQVYSVSFLLDTLTILT